jgi:hypothetical protein
MQVTLGDTQTFQVMRPETWQVGTYQGYLICGSPFGFFIVQPEGDLVLTFAGFVVFAPTPQEAGIIIDSHLATCARPATTKEKRKPSRIRRPSKRRSAPHTRSRART